MVSSCVDPKAMKCIGYNTNLFKDNTIFFDRNFFDMKVRKWGLGWNCLTIAGKSNKYKGNKKQYLALTAQKQGFSGIVKMQLFILFT